MIKTSTKFVRKWCQLPICANVKHLSFPLSELGINFKLAKMFYNQCKLWTCRILRQSKNPEIQKLYTLTSSRHINHDYLINSVSSENQNQVLSNKQFNSRVNRKLNKMYLIIPGTNLWTWTNCIYCFVIYWKLSSKSD